MTQRKRQQTADSDKKKIGTKRSKAATRIESPRADQIDSPDDKTTGNKRRKRERTKSKKVAQTQPLEADQIGLQDKSTENGPTKATLIEPPPSDQTELKDSLLGTTLAGCFSIESIIGAGGMSVVYKARQIAVDRYVAIKTIGVQVSTKPAVKECFEREVKSLCRMSHPNIVTVHDCVIGDNGRPYIVMDYLRGQSLEQILRNDGPLSIAQFDKICTQVFTGLDYAHKQGVTHRDLKPGNIMLTDDELQVVKIVDFGLAKFKEDNRKITHPGELWGSPPYISPEQCAGVEADARTDIYSFGVVMYELLTGKDPFFGSRLQEFVHKHLYEPPPPMSKANPKVVIPPEIETVVMKCLEKSPDKRYQSMSELSDAMARVLHPLQLSDDAL